jgi:hypothetical protein
MRDFSELSKKHDLGFDTSRKVATCTGCDWAGSGDEEWEILEYVAHVRSIEPRNDKDAA